MSFSCRADRISILPKNVTEAILMHLSTKDAVRTSALSRSWRYEWCTLPRILIDKKSFPFLPDRVVKIVDHILLLHCGPINSFKLSVCVSSSADIDRWILFLSRNGIKRFALDKLRGQIYKLPSCLFSCVDLNYLELYRCEFSPPPSFKGFYKLTTIDLHNVTFDDNSFQLLMSTCPLLKSLKLKNITGCPPSFKGFNKLTKMNLQDVAFDDKSLDLLLSTCPLLESLTLKNVTGSTRLRTSLPKLLYLEIEGEFEDIHFKITPHLATASFNLVSTPDDSLEGRVIDRVLGSLPSIERLELLDDTLRNLSTGDVPVSLPLFWPLKHLRICMNFEDMQEVLAAFCIFRSSLVMQKLDIKAISDENDARVPVNGFWEEEENFNCPFSHLQVVKVVDFTAATSELNFIKYVLANAPVLERLHIEFYDDIDGALEIFKELIRLPRSSSKAEIILL